MKYKNTRCSICNQVSHEDISDDLSPWSHKRFYDVGGQFVCQECEDWHDELMGDYYQDEEEDEDSVN